MIKRTLWIVILAVVALATAAALFAPYVYVELWPWRTSYTLVSPGPAKVAKGQMVDDYFVVQDLGAGTYAIGEPRYYQANYSYLIIGKKRALLFDAGSGTRTMRPVIAALTKLPVTVLPSHLHYDHLGGVHFFDHIAMLDLKEIREGVIDGYFSPGRYAYLGMLDGLQAPSFKVSEWIKPGATIDLGDRSLTVLATPGHTSQSAAVLDSANRRLFAGDFIYPTMLYAFLPDASLSAYRKTTHSLLSTLPADTILWGAHCCRKDEGYAAPWLTMTDLKDLDRTLAQLKAGSDEGDGLFPRRYPVNNEMILGVGFPWNNR